MTESDKKNISIFWMTLIACLFRRSPGKLGLIFYWRNLADKGDLNGPLEDLYVRNDMGK
jgi:hypothetical protein